MKKVHQSLSVAQTLERISCEFGLTQEEVNELYLSLLSEDAKFEALESDLEARITEILNAVGLIEEEGVYEPESLPAILSSSIYNIQSNEDLLTLKEIEDTRLDEGSAPVDNLKELEVQANAHFKNPKRYNTSEEPETEPFVRCYISIYSRTIFDNNGKAVNLYKPTGASFTLPLSKAILVEGISEGVKTTGFEMNETIQIKVYGNKLYDLVGARPYGKDESAEFKQYFEECSNILFAIPDSEVICLNDEDILDRLVQDEIIYGRSASEVLKGAYSQWILNQEFYDVRYPELEEEKLRLDHEARILTMINNKKEFRSSFSKEVDIINALNDKKCSLSEVAHLTAHELNRILYVCRSNDFDARIHLKSVYMQIQAMAHKKASSEESSLYEVQSSSSESASKLIEYINGGGFINLDSLDLETLNSVFSVLWDKRSQMRIHPKYKETYFILKDRYLSLKTKPTLKVA